MASQLYRKVLACIAGAAIGDSMGSSVECLHHTTIAKYFGEIRDLRRSRGKISDDTLIRLATYAAIVEKGGRVDALDLARKWKEVVTPRDEFWVTELFVSAQLHMGLSPRETGSHNIRADDAAMAIDPIGVVNCCNPRNAAADARDIAGISQKGVEVDAAMGFAASVASAFIPDTNTDAVVDSARRYSSSAVKRKIEKAMTIVDSQSSEQRIYSRLYDEVAVEDGSSDIVRTWRRKDPSISKFIPGGISLGISGEEVVPVALSLFHAGRGDPTKVVRMCVGYGRDSDTIAGIGGALAGAFSGTIPIGEGLVERINRANGVSLERLATKLMQPIQNVWRESQLSVDRGRRLLDLD